MVAYFVRRLAEGAVAMLAMTFVLYSLLVYFPGGVLDFVNTGNSLRDRFGLVSLAVVHSTSDYKLYKPWPESYLAWLFDPQDVEDPDPNDYTTYVPKGIDFQICRVRLRGSGILTGDWGESYQVARGQANLELMGESFWLYDLIILGMTLLGMALVVFKRIGHTPRFAPPRFPFTAHDRVSLTFRYTQHP